jgi:hypothetical protein
MFADLIVDLIRRKLVFSQLPKRGKMCVCRHKPLAKHWRNHILRGHVVFAQPLFSFEDIFLQLALSQVIMILWNHPYFHTQSAQMTHSAQALRQMGMKLRHSLCQLIVHALLFYLTLSQLKYVHPLESYHLCSLFQLSLQPQIHNDGISHVWRTVRSPHSISAAGQQQRSSF